MLDSDTKRRIDPACGTVGFLISAFKHIRRANTDRKGHSTLTPDDKARLAANFKGYDISPDMVRLSLVNLYLHGFTEPHVYEYDTLTSLERWNEHYDVIFANPPFMSPKGGIKPHKRFSIHAKRSEVLFVDYIAEHLTPNGRAAIIVPEGIIFQSQGAYKELRKMLVENSLVAVISLPAGCFNPYSGVKTSILILDKALARQSDSIGFFKVENDGYGLGAQRRAIEKNDLPQVKAEVTTFLQALRDRQPTADLQPTCGLIVPKEKIAANGDYNLSGERYREGIMQHSIYPRVLLEEIAEVRMGETLIKGNLTGKGKPIFSADSSDEPWAFSEPTRLSFGKNTLVIGARGTIGSVKFPNIECFTCTQTTIAITAAVERILPEFLYHWLKAFDFKTVTEGVGIPMITVANVNKFEIPLPPLSVQQEIVAEIEGYQKVINGARAVLDHYRPHIPIHPDWPLVEIGSISTIVRGSSPRPQGDPSFFGGPVPRLMVADITRDGMYATPQIDSLTELGATKSRPMKKGEVVITVSGNPGLPTILAIDACIHDGFVGLRELSKDVLPTYLYFALLALHASHGAQSVGAVFKNLTTDQIREFKIALPPLATQRAIVAEIEAEQALVAANRELITRFEQKIQATLARVWGEEGPSATPHASPVRRARPQAPPPPVAEEADEEAEAGSEEGAEKEHPSAEAEEGSTTAPLRPTRPDEMDKSDFMSLLRDVLTEHGPCDRDTVIKQAATSLGYQRVRGGLAGILANAIRTAVRRQVLLNGGNIYSVNRAGIADLDMEFLKTQFLAAISEQGRVWTTREDATRAFARWFGFRRTGSVIDETARKLIPRLLRAGRLEKDGDSIKRV